MSIRVLSLGAGVQSTTLLLMALHNEIERPDHVVFADTGWEPQRVYDHLTWLRTLMSDAQIPFHVVSNGNLHDDFLNPDKRSGSIPVYLSDTNGNKGIMRRQCTAEYKLRPLMAKQRELAGLKPGQRCKEHRITTVIGISYDEIQRMKDPAFTWIRHEYPLIDKKLTRQHCLDWCKKHNYPTPPRSACIGCPYKRNDEWQILKENPTEWENAVAFDEALRTAPHLQKRFRMTPYLHNDRVPLAEADLRTAIDHGVQTLFDSECEGMCGN